jgi:uncharacterized membrane protein YkoI
MRVHRISALLAILLAVTIPLAVPPRAGAAERDDVHRDQVRRAVEAGEIRSLAEILNAVRGKLPGDVAGVEIERKNGRWLYEFRVVGSEGRLFDVYIDARSGEIERIKEK